MAKDKKSFLLYCEIYETVKKLNDKTAGELFKHILSYVNDEDPKTDNEIIDLVFIPIKQSLKRDLVKWENIANRNKINGLKGGRPPNPAEPKEPTGLSGNPKKPKEPVSVIVNDSVKVSGNVNEKEKKEKKGMFNMSDVVNPFVEMKGFTELWDLWIQYRKEKRISAYKPIGFQGAVKKLWELSDGNIETATKIVHESISNGWTGLFELKNNGRKKEKRDYKALDERIDAELARRAGNGDN